jgi:hypothetical protein
VRHSPKCPEGWQPVNLVGNSARGAGDLSETGPPPQPAAASTSTAASAAHNLSQRFEFRSPDARADRMPAMVTISCRTQVASCRAQPHPARVIGSPITTVLRLGSGHEGRTSSCWSCGYQPGLTADQLIPAPAERRRDRIKIPVQTGTVVPVVCDPIGVSRSCPVAGVRRPEDVCGEPDDTGVDRDLDGGVDATVVWPAGCGLRPMPASSWRPRCRYGGVQAPSRAISRSRPSQDPCPTCCPVVAGHHRPGRLHCPRNDANPEPGPPARTPRSSNRSAARAA